MKAKLAKEIGFVTKGQKPMHAATVEEALKITGFGKYNFGLLLVCSWTLQAMGMDLFGSSFTVAAAVCDLALTIHQRALLTATPLIGVVLGAQLWGYVSDTRGRRLTLVLSMSVGFVFGTLSSLAPDWISMAGLKLLSSTFTSACNSGAYTLVGESCDSRTRVRAMLLCTCALMCSQAVAAVLAYPILPMQFSYWIEFLGISYRPWRLLMFVMSLPCAATACLLLMFHESPKFLASRGKNEEALQVLRSIYAWNTGNQCGDFPVKKLIPDEEDKSSQSDGSFMAALWQQTAPLFKAPLLKRTLQLFYLVIVIYMTGSGFILWLPYIMNNMFSVLEVGGGSGMNLCSVIGMSPADAVVVSGNDTMTAIVEVCNDTIQDTTLLSAMTYGALASSANLVLSLTASARKRQAMLCIVSTSAMSALLINLVSEPIAGILFFFLFLLCALSMGILSVYFVELYPTSLRGMASCLSVMLGRSSAFFGVNAIGPLLHANCEATFYAWSALLMSALVFTWYLPKDKKSNLTTDK